MMKKVIVLTVVMLMALGVAANAYILNAVADNGAGQYGMSAITLNSANATVKETNMVANPGNAAEVYSTGSTGDKRLSQYFLTSEPTSWFMTLTAAAGYTGNQIRLKMYSPNLAGSSPTKIYTLKANGVKVWEGAFFATTSSSTAPKISQTFAYSGAPIALEFTAVPEPGSIVAMLSGLVGLVGYGIRRRK